MQKVVEFFYDVCAIAWKMLRLLNVTKVSENFDQSLFGGSWRKIFESATLNRNKSSEEAKLFFFPPTFFRI